MSLRLRLILLIVALVALVAVTLSALHLDTLLRSLSEDAAKQSELASQQVSSFLSDHVNQHYKDRATPATMEETRAVWRDIVSTDPDIANMLEKMMALSHSLVEINVADEHHAVLVSSNPQRVGMPIVKMDSLSDWGKRPLNRRLLDLMARRPDYEVAVPIGNIGQNEPLFTVQVVSSGVFLRDALMPDVERLAAVSGGVLAVSLLLTLLATQTILRPLRHIEETIDRIVQGNYGGEQSRGAMAKEFAVVETKLNLLGQKFRGAREDASELRSNVGQLLERMATQIDVGARLAAISRLTGGVAHEIKNPLNAIALRLDLLGAKLGAPDEDLVPKKELVNDIEILSKEVLRLDRVVKTFLDFSRPVEVHFLKLDLAELAREVCVLLSPQAKVAHVDLVFEASSEVAQMRGDADMLRQVILNLVTNAIEAMKDGGKIVVKVAQETQAVVMDITDTGPGIDPKLRDRVFQLYFTTKTRGSGIGLAMTFRAVQMHNGTIDFASETGRGTTFHIQFPVMDVRRD
jgi:signal transduction histidine kinase